jgi:hypothetical protein
VFWEFLEAVAALSVFAFKNPYLPLETKIDQFIGTILITAPQVRVEPFVVRTHSAF